MNLAQLAPDTTVTVPAELTREEAWLFAQFLKRVGHSDYRRNACDSEEAYVMLAAGEKIRAALAREGFAPR